MSYLFRPFLFSNLKRFRDEKKFCDVDIYIGKEIFSCHRNVLASACQYFENQFDKNKTEIKLNEFDVDVSTFTILLDFIYNGKVTVSRQNANTFLCAAVRLGLNNIEELYDTFISNNLPIINVFEMSKFAEIFNKNSLRNKIVGNIAENFEYISVKDDFGKISENLLERVLTHEKLQCDSDKTIKGFINWMRKKTEVSLDYGESKEIQKRGLFHDFRTLHLKVAISGSRRVERYEFDDESWKRIEVHDKLRNYKTVKYKGSQYRLVNGYFGGANNINKMYRFDDEKEIDVQVFPVDCNRYHFLAANDLLYVHIIDGGFGGWDNITRRFDIEQKRYDIYSYIPEINQWFRIPEAELNRFSTRCVATIDNLLYVCGGFPDIEGPLVKINHANFYDHRENKWHKLPELLNKRVNAAACAYDGKIYVNGGKGESSMEVFDRVAGKWRKLRPMKFNREEHVFLPHNGLLYAFGDCKHPFEIYDPEKNNWFIGPRFDTKLIKGEENFKPGILDVCFQ